MSNHPALTDYPWEPVFAEPDNLSVTQWQLLASNHQIMALEAAISGVGGSGYPLPPPSGRAPLQAELMPTAPGQSVPISNNPALSHIPAPVDTGEFVEVQPGLLQRNTPWTNPNPPPTMATPIQGSVKANVNKTTNHVSAEASAPSVGPIQHWDLATAKAEYDTQLQAVQVQSRSAAAGGVRSTLRPPPSAAGFWGVPIRVTPGVAPRTFARTKAYGVGTPGVMLTAPIGASHGLYEEGL
jgi:hypothetical protein